MHMHMHNARVTTTYMVLTELSYGFNTRLSALNNINTAELVHVSKKCK